ncbi:MAG: UvrD-helicase domain-containing protein [Cyanobacteria bacterium SZAS TMP-1]|nr:UvrD-helicase domain-containing protein [Cyanobacteria bacterium SZAS TMP-1]
MHWFVDSVGLYMGSVRGLFLSDYSEDQEALIEAAVINFKSRGVSTMVVSGDMLYKQAEYLFQHAVSQSPFGRPLLSKMELDMLDADVVIVKDMAPPTTPPQLWYVYHHLLYPRALGQKTLLLSTPLGYDEFLAAGAQCEDLEYAGRRITWEKACWLLDGIMIDLHHFRQLRSESLPPMLKAEYFLYKTCVSRGLKPTPQYVVGDYSVDFALVERGNKLAIECDVLASLDQPNKGSFDAKRTLVLLSDGWKLLRFTTIDLLSNLGECADAVDETWVKGYKKSPAGRLISGQNSSSILELPVEDDVQRLAIINGAGPVAITGGAGTGKSTCIVRRAAYLLAQGVSPEKILVVSHSTDSVRALREEVEKLVDRPTVQKMPFYSWNELGLKLLKENTGAIKRKPPLKVEANPQRIIQRLLTKYRKDLDLLTLELAEELEEYTIASLISLYKANLVTPKHVKDKAKSTVDELVAKVYLGYDEQLQKSNKIDRDDMVSLAAQLLADHPDIRARYQYQYDFVLVDEFQDATAAADLLARTLALPQDNLYIAGDEDESIFESKGALPKILSEVSVRLPNGRCYVLERNWRNHPDIVNASINLLQGLHKRRIAKEMEPAWEVPDTQAIIGPHLAESESQEAEWVAGEIQTLLDAGRNPQDIAILYRYNRYASMVEEALFRKGIKCLTTNPDSTMVPDEVADVMAFLRLVMDPDGPKARESFERVCQLRSKEVDPKLFGTIASFAEANNLSFIKAVEIYSEAVADQSCQDVGQLVLIIRTMNHENLPPAETIALLKRTQRLNEYYKSVKVPPGVNYEPMRKLGQLEEEARKYKTVAEFVKSQQSSQKGGPDSPDAEPLVYILSLHEAKGKEYPVVFLTGMAEGLFPSETANDPEEERRLCYLGISRAKELLYLSYPSQFNDVALAPSRYLVDMGLVMTEPVITPEMQQEALFVAQQKAAQLKAQQDDLLRAQQQAQLKAQQPVQYQSPAQAQLAAQQRAQAAAQQSQLAAQQQAQLAAQQQAQLAAQQQAQLAAQQQAQLAAQQQAQLLAKQQAEAAARAQQEELARQQQEALLKQQQLQQQELQRQQEEYLRMQQEAQLRAQQEEQYRLEQEEQLRLQQEAQQRAHYEAQVRAQQVAALREQQEQLAIAKREAQARAEQEAMARAQEEERIKAEQLAQEMRVKEAKEEEFIRQQQILVVQQREEAARKAAESAALIAQQEAQMQALREQEAIIRAEQEAQQQAELAAQQEAEAIAAQQAAHEAERLAREQAEAQAQEQSRLALERAQQAQQMLFQAKTPPAEAAPPPPPQPEAPKKGKGKKKAAAASEPLKEDFSPSVPIGEPPSAVPSFAAADPGLPPSSAAAFEPPTAPAYDYAAQANAYMPTTQSDLAPVAQGQYAPFADPALEAPAAGEDDAVIQTFYDPTQDNPALAAPVAAASAPAPAPAPAPEPPDPRDVFWSNVNNSMIGGVKEVSPGGTLPPSGYGAKAREAAQAAQQAPQPAPQPVHPAQHPPHVPIPGLTSPLAQDPDEFYPDGVIVPGPMSSQLARQYPNGVPQPVVPQAPQQRLPQPAPVMPTGALGMVCPGCTTHLEPGSRFCGECGFRLEVRITACHLCGAPLEPNSRFCGECGSQLRDKGPSPAMAVPQPAMSEESQRYETYLSGQKPSQQGWVTKLKKLLD